MRNYRDLQVWEKAHALTLAVYKHTQPFPSEERFALTSQIRRSCSSIAANLAEVLRSKIGWRDGSLCADSYGIRC